MKRDTLWLWFLGVNFVVALAIGLAVKPIFGWYWYVEAWIIQAAYIWMSLRMINSNEVGALLLWGDPYLMVGPGLCPVLWGIFTLEKTARIIELEYPDPVKVYDGDGPLPEGKVTPMRVTHAEGTVEDRKTNPLSSRMTTEVKVFCKLEVKNFLELLSTVGGAEELERHLEDFIPAEVRRLFAKKTPNDALLGWNELQKEIEGGVTDIVETYGVKVLAVKILEIDLGHTMNSSIRDAAKAAADLIAKNREHDAEAYREKVIGESKALAKTLDLAAVAGGRQALLFADVEGAKRMATEVLTTEGGQLAAKLESTVQIATAMGGNANKTVVLSENLAGTVVGAAAAFQAMGGIGGNPTPPHSQPESDQQSQRNTRGSQNRPPQSPSSESTPTIQRPTGTPTPALQPPQQAGTPASTPTAGVNPPRQAQGSPTTRTPPTNPS